MEDMVYDTFEQLFSEDKSEKPSLGPHRFKVIASDYDDDRSKWWFILANKEGQQIKKSCYLADPTKKKANMQWVACLFDSMPSGRYVDFDRACVGR